MFNVLSFPSEKNVKFPNYRRIRDHHIVRWHQGDLIAELGPGLWSCSYQSECGQNPTPEVQSVVKGNWKCGRGSRKGRSARLAANLPDGFLFPLEGKAGEACPTPQTPPPSALLNGLHFLHKHVILTFIFLVFWEEMETKVATQGPAAPCLGVECC